MVCTAHRASDLPGLGGLPSPSVDVVDPWLASSGPFISALNEFQLGSLGDRSLGVPAWALYDCAEATGAVVGFSNGASGLGNPISMIAATPTVREGAWHFYALCARESSLLRPTLELAIELIRPREITAVIGYTEESFAAYVGLGWAGLMTAWTPAHSVPASATIRIVAEDSRSSGGDYFELNTRRADDLIRVQRDIENGDCLRVSTPPDANGMLTVERASG